MAFAILYVNVAQWKIYNNFNINQSLELEYLHFDYPIGITYTPNSIYLLNLLHEQQAWTQVWAGLGGGCGNVYIAS